MENQHRLIKGYRELTASEIADMNAVKALGEEMRRLIQNLRERGADPRWVAIGETQLQQGHMALVRSIAKPEGF